MSYSANEPGLKRRKPKAADMPRSLKAHFQDRRVSPVKLIMIWSFQDHIPIWNDEINSKNQHLTWKWNIVEQDNIIKVNCDSKQKDRLKDRWYKKVNYTCSAQITKYLSFILLVIKKIFLLVTEISFPICLLSTQCYFMVFLQAT